LLFFREQGEKIRILIPLRAVGLAEENRKIFKLTRKT